MDVERILDCPAQVYELKFVLEFLDSDFSRHFSTW